jgi:hypothetical protein
MNATQTHRAQQNETGQRDATAELSQSERIASLPPHLAIMKMDNDNITSLAAAHPRDMAQIKRELEITLTEFPGLAEEAIYSKPVGKVVDVKCKCGDRFEQAVTRNNDAYTCPRCGNAQHERNAISKPRQKFARGLSVRAAETLAEAYGYNRTRSGVTPINDDTVKVEATFVDYQRGRIWQDDMILSKWFRGRNGAMTRIADDRFYGLTVKAEKSKLIREVVIRSVNPGLKAWFEARCESIQEELLTDGKIDALVRGFAEFHVTLPMLETLIGRTREQGWTVKDRKQLIAVGTALRDNETTVAEVFFDEDPGEDKSRSKPPQGPATAESLANGTGSATAAVDQKPAEAAASGPAQQTSPSAGGKSTASGKLV